MSITLANDKGRKSQMVDLNVVPFIDFLSCLIAFLMLGAVWAQTAALDLDQSVAGEGSLTISQPPPLTLHLSAAGMWMGRDAASGTTVPAADDAPDWKAIRALVAADRAAFPTEQIAVINTDDGVPYEQMILAMDLTRELGYGQTLLAGGAPGR